MASTPDFDLIAVTYLAQQEVGPRLRDLALTVAAYRANNEAPGRQSSRKADLNAVAGAARRLQRALAKIDPRSQVEGLHLGCVKREEAASGAEANTGVPPAGAAEAPKAVTDISGHQYQMRVAELSRLRNTLETVVLGFGVLADGQSVVASGGRPERHDALVMGLEGLTGFWKRHRAEQPTQSENAGGFGAFALDMFAGGVVGFSAATVRGAVVDMLELKNVT